ncbi:MAG: tannase/feruloyl esterase family alpha/beta hydrolase [Bryobacterales bacterium]|nr:tannase/feruloyl esterase family alpha/beta hydrolase [Bryobacterales bacterium]
MIRRCSPAVPRCRASIIGTGIGTSIRLFLVPGMFHCGGGLGFSQADYFVSLMACVETDNVPQRIEASRVVGGDT